MASPPSRTDLAGTPTVATYKLAIGGLYDYVASLLGNGTATIASETEKKLARESLGVGSFGFKNRFINPEFAVDQRNNGSAITVTAGGSYVTDRWYATSAGANVTAQRIAGISENEYSLRFTGASSNTSVELAQRIESVNSADFKNKDITVSFKTKASAARTITWSAYYANVVNTFATKTLIATGTINITTTVEKFSFTFNAGSNAGNGIVIDLNGGALLAGSTVDFDAMQLEQSSIATEFEKRNYYNELSLCKVYYQAGASRFDGYVTSGQIYSVPVSFSVEMRAVPTLALTNGANSNFLADVASYSVSPRGYFDARGSNGTGGGTYVTFYTASAEI